MILDWDRKWLGDFNARKSQLVSFVYLNNQCNDHNMDEPVLDGKLSLKILSLLSILNWIGALKLSFNETTHNKSGALICFMKILSCEVALYLFIYLFLRLLIN